MGRPIYWYDFVDFNEQEIPSKFLNVPFTKYYEFGGDHKEALAELVGIQISEGDEL